ncbi:hypothetical protein E2C01_035936 [Portunus trituberculatus]|uniref:Uncharacterized protein n=1 Tax=Portunus trituberculatus TaxID=210409 RepID=A0A5B7F9T9_PORTR|nr:hypothetical protein [Portunus trituberculatus]
MTHPRTMYLEVSWAGAVGLWCTLINTYLKVPSSMSTSATLSNTSAISLLEGTFGIPTRTIHCHYYHHITTPHHTTTVISAPPYHTSPPLYF